jgi:lysophospholipase L1-like esterase
MKKIAIGLSLGLNVLILCVAAWVALGGGVWLAMKFVINPQQERVATQYELLDVEPGDTVFLGDSITYGGQWDELFPDTPTRQRGIDGDTTSGVLARLAPIASAKPRQVFLLIGTDDLFFGVPEEEIVANVTEIVERILNASPETEVYVQSVLPRAARYQQRVESLNAALEPAVAPKATWINLYPRFLDDAGTSIENNISNDELHLLGPGYMIWRDAITPMVARRSNPDQ